MLIGRIGKSIESLLFVFGTSHDDAIQAQQVRFLEAKQRLPKRLQDAIKAAYLVRPVLYDDDGNIVLDKFSPLIVEGEFDNHSRDEASEYLRNLYGKDAGNIHIIDYKTRITSEFDKFIHPSGKEYRHQIYPLG